ncbi:hypothetical protein GCM10011380_17130 [Sphingomonas metalli]|uniref:Uncharacterized protein n=1 Tax=Sphingomonas metalli TaxID=1779358 RepID=A0A916T461_9SPHN|nr:hypothetical protein [Sphingomonas metalli]GGB28101.1 hypothetical protein GCM10011380_17130 [Sphingomonas metalli]
MTTEELIGAAVARCDRIVAGFDDLRPVLAPVLPVTGDDLTKLPPAERIASIALLKRYEQLQDMLGRLFRAYLTWELEDVREMTRRDQANQLERLGVVADADDWVAAAELRNRLVHEYPIDEAEQVDRVNDTWNASFGLIKVYTKLRARLAQQGLLS